MTQCCPVGKTCSRHPQIRPQRDGGKYLPTISGGKKEKIMIFIYFFLPSVWHKYNRFFFTLFMIRSARWTRQKADDIFSSHLRVPGVAWTLMQGCLLREAMFFIFFFVKFLP